MPARGSARVTRGTVPRSGSARTCSAPSGASAAGESGSNPATAEVSFPGATGSAGARSSPVTSSIAAGSAGTPTTSRASRSASGRRRSVMPPAGPTPSTVVAPSRSSSSATRSAPSIDDCGSTSSGTPSPTAVAAPNRRPPASPSVARTTRSAASNRARLVLTAVVTRSASATTASSASGAEVATSAAGRPSRSCSGPVRGASKDVQPTVASTRVRTRAADREPSERRPTVVDVPGRLRMAIIPPSWRTRTRWPGSGAAR